MEGVVSGQKIDLSESTKISKNNIKLNKGLHILLCTVSDELDLSIFIEGSSDAHILGSSITT